MKIVFTIRLANVRSGVPNDTYHPNNRNYLRHLSSVGGVGTWGGGLLIFDMDNIDGPLTAGYSEDTISEEKIPSTMPMYNRPYICI